MASRCNAMNTDRYKWWRHHTPPIALNRNILYIPLKRSGMTCVFIRDHTVLPATKHEPYLPLLSASEHHHPFAGTHCADPRRDGQAELTWVLVTYRYKCSRAGSWTHIRSPIPVLTGPDVQQRRNNYTKPPPVYKSVVIILNTEIFQGGVVTRLRTGENIYIGYTEFLVEIASEIILKICHQSPKS